MLGILAERQRVEEIAEQTPLSKVRNVLSAGTLAHLFDERKACKTQAELDELSREFGMDPEIVERLAKHLNSPSISKIALPTKDANDTPKQLVSACGAVGAFLVFATECSSFRFTGAMGRPARQSSGTAAPVCMNRRLVYLVAGVKCGASRLVYSICPSSCRNSCFASPSVRSGRVHALSFRVREYLANHLVPYVDQPRLAIDGSLQGR